MRAIVVNWDLKILKLTLDVIELQKKSKKKVLEEIILLEVAKAFLISLKLQFEKKSLGNHELSFQLLS